MPSTCRTHGMAELTRANTLGYWSTLHALPASLLWKKLKMPSRVCLKLNIYFHSILLFLIYLIYIYKPPIFHQEYWSTRVSLTSTRPITKRTEHEFVIIQRNFNYLIIQR